MLQPPNHFRILKRPLNITKRRENNVLQSRKLPATKPHGYGANRMEYVLPYTLLKQVATSDLIVSTLSCVSLADPNGIGGAR